MLLAVPFIVVVFPIASIIAILVSLGVYKVLAPLTQETPAFWLTLLIALIPFLAALNVEKWAEGFRGYRLARHLLRVVGVPWLGAQYLVYGPALFGPSHRAPSLSFAQFIGQVVSRPGVLGAVIALAWLAHLVGSGFDLSGRRPASWRQFFLPRGSILRQPAPPGLEGRRAAPPAAAAARKPLELSRKLMASTELGFAVGIAAAIVLTDYDSAAMVILRIGTLSSVVFAGVVLVHHALRRKARSGVRP